jgi:type IV pilus assembly protein PilV
MKSNQRHGIIQRQQGIGLIEVLVALLLLAIGVVGFAGLQVRAIAATSEAFQRSQAMILARDMGERIRVNSIQSARTIYLTESSWTGTSYSGTCISLACTPDNLARYDIAQIKLLAATIGPNGQARMQVCPSNTAIHCLYVSWNETQPINATSVNDAACTFNGSFQSGSNCIMLETY